jgi:hypothetical protein
MLSLACKHHRVVCLGGESFLSFDLRMFHPVDHCASALSHCCLWPDLRACVHHQVVWFNCCRHCLLARKPHMVSEQKKHYGFHCTFFFAGVHMVVEDVSWELFKERFRERYLSEEFIEHQLNEFNALR